MSSEIKSEDESSGESDDNLEVMRTSSGPLQTYRPHKRAQTTDNTHPAKQPRLEGAESNESPENMESSNAEPVEVINMQNNNNDSAPARAQTSAQVDPEIVVISDSEDDDIEVSETHVISPNQEPDNLEHGIIPAVRNFTEFMRHVAGVNIDPQGLQRSRLSPQQRHMWLRQQADAENRRRRATSNPARYIPFVAEAVTPGDTSPHALYRIHIGPPIMQTIQTRLPRELQEERQRSCVATTIINRYTVLYPFTESNTNNHEQKTCVVCITEFQTGQSVRRLPCMHIFHKECVDKWIIHNMKCPICRYALIRNQGQAIAHASSS